MYKLLNIMDSQKELLKFIGYDIDLSKGKIPLFETIQIKKDGKKVGTFDIKRLNLYYLHKDGYFIGNIISQPSFSRKKEKNMRAVCHIKLIDGNIKFDCYNGVENGNLDQIILDNYVVIQNENYRLVKMTERFKKEFSIDYSDQNISFFFIWTELGSKIIIRFGENEIYLENERENTYIRLKNGEKIIEENGTLNDILENNKEVFQKVTTLVINSAKVDLFNNSIKYINKKAKENNKEQSKVYKPE